MAANPEPSADYCLANTLFPVLDRRASPRFRAVCFDVKVVRGENAGLFRARNISDSGMMLDTHWRFAVGERVLIKLSERLALHGAVSWSDGRRCGIEFEHPIDCVGLLRAGAELKREDRRGGALRLATMTRATCYAENGIRAVKVTDVSHHGMGLAHDGSLAEGMSLKLVVESGVERSAAVCWATGGRAGVRLTEPLSCEELDRVGEIA
jgi:hypothetical protein